MLFNSNEFLIFFCLVFVGYFLLAKRPGAQNVLILISSCVFYGTWSVLFLLLMLFTASMDYLFGLAMGRAKTGVQKRVLLVLSLCLNLGILGYFKYWGFLSGIFRDLFSTFGAEGRASAWSIILPVGISFYTFQSISYVIDVYRGTIPAERSWVRFMAYVTYFPQLVAGPIERAGHLLPQFRRERNPTSGDIEEGTWLLLWGFFKKVVIADNLAFYSDLVFSRDTFSFSIYLLGAAAFGIQIYCDFSGYSDIARGLARFFGIDLMFNFRNPYAATSAKEFWGRWHISLSQWFRDYLYIPLGGNRGGLGRTSANLMIVMAVAGLWHGASWTFMLWGLWHGAALVLNLYWRQVGFGMPKAVGWILTMAMVLVGWIFFRATSLEQLYAMFFVNSGAEAPLWRMEYVKGLIIFAIPLVCVECVQVFKKNLVWPVALPLVPKSLFYGVLVAFILIYWEKEGTPFIYFQF